MLGDRPWGEKNTYDELVAGTGGDLEDTSGMLGTDSDCSMLTFNRHRTCRSVLETYKVCFLMLIFLIFNAHP